MHPIKFLGGLLAQMHQLEGANFKAVFLQARQNLPQQAPTHRIRLDNRKGLLAHRSSPFATAPLITAATSRPRSAGLRHTRMPAACIAAILLAAVPWPPEMMAPAWPIRRPGGA